MSVTTVKLQSLLNTRDLAKMFDRSSLTIHLWKKKFGLPYIRIPGAGRDTIRYDKKAVKAWAKENDKEIFKL